MQVENAPSNDPRGAGALKTWRSLGTINRPPCSSASCTPLPPPFVVLSGSMVSGAVSNWAKF